MVKAAAYRSAWRRCAALSVCSGVLAIATTASAEAYVYDALNRLVQVTSDAGVVTYYCYDKAGNRTYVGPTACPP